MSIVAFKKKSVIQYGSGRSGKPPGGYFLPQGPFGKNMFSLQQTKGPVGFSLNGGHRNVGYVGKTMEMSQNGTPFRGTQPLGTGGVFGTYPSPPPVFNVNEVIVLATQYQYIKPSVLSTRGMLQKKYKWIYNGQYPNFWVQPNYAGTTQSDSKSQGMYVHNVTTSNLCVTDVNATDKYVDFIVEGGPTLCNTSTAKFKYDNMAQNGKYTKFLKQPLSSEQQTAKIQRKCTDPVGTQKPFPFSTNGSTCNQGQQYLAPPEWYINSNQQIPA
jgi:hypothetical protein